MTDIPIEEFSKKYLDVKDLLPEGTEIFIGITLKLENKSWKQKSAFAKVQKLGTAKKEPKVSKQQQELMEKSKKSVEEFNQMELNNATF